jgi:hypothetical protein
MENDPSRENAAFEIRRGTSTSYSPFRQLAAYVLVSILALLTIWFFSQLRSRIAETDVQVQTLSKRLDNAISEENGKFSQQQSVNETTEQRLTKLESPPKKIVPPRHKQISKPAN